MAAINSLEIGIRLVAGGLLILTNGFFVAIIGLGVLLTRWKHLSPVVTSLRRYAFTADRKTPGTD